MRARSSYLKPVIMVVLIAAACGGGGQDALDPMGGLDASFRCGNGTVDAAEDCDEEDLGGATCESLGFASGTLGCDLLTCRFDTSGCDSTQTLTNHDGQCESNLGCTSTDGTGTSGNQQSIVECVNNARLGLPFFVNQVSYIIRTPAPDSLDIEVYSWTGLGQPGTLQDTIPVGPGDTTLGPHTIFLANPVQIDEPTFCVGVAGSDPEDGFRIAFSQTATSSGTAWTKTTNCGSGGFQDVVTKLNQPGVTTGSWCITTVIDKSPPQ